MLSSSGPQTKLRGNAEGGVRKKKSLPLTVCLKSPWVTTFGGTRILPAANAVSSFYLYIIAREFLYLLHCSCGITVIFVDILTWAITIIYKSTIMLPLPSFVIAVWLLILLSQLLMSIFKDGNMLSCCVCHHITHHNLHAMLKDLSIKRSLRMKSMS